MTNGLKRRVFLIILFLGCASSVSVFAAERMTVTADIANIRSGPGMDSDQLWKIEKYHPVMVLEKKGEWCRVKDFEGDEGWVHSSLLGNAPAVIVKTRRCNVRSGPGSQFDVVFTVEKGVPFKVIGKKGRWIEVKHADGDTGWLFDALVW